MANREERYQKFVDECEDEGLDVDKEYHGRNYYNGPAVRCDNLDEMVDVIRVTTGKLQWDNLGLGYIIYPR
jgi:hypothetical protein